MGPGSAHQLRRTALVNHMVREQLGSNGPQTRAVTFDFWGTLYDNQEARPIRMAQLRDYLGREGRHVPDGHLGEAYDHAHHVAHDSWREEHRSLSTASRVDTMLGYLGIEVSPGLRREITREFEEALLKMPPRPVPGVHRLLHELRERELRIGLISDTGITPGRVLRQVMAHDGLLPLFKHCTFSNEVGRAKPHPFPFQRTLEALKTTAQSATHIGDLPTTDIAGAKRVGMRAVLFTGVTGRPDDNGGADALLGSYGDVRAALHALCGG